MAAIQAQNEIQSLLARLEGHHVEMLQVFGINSLKSVSPVPGALVGEAIRATSVDESRFTIDTENYQIVVDLQRSGKVVWLANAQPYTIMAGSRPTDRLILANGQGMDLSEPVKTKRVTIALLDRVMR